MILTPEQEENILEPAGENQKRRKRRGLGRGLTGFHIWDYGNVPYAISKDFGKFENHFFKLTISPWS